ncbi:MAG: anti-sigma factor family protein [Hyphomicrobium sp.]
MTRPNDDVLNAYADGALDSAKAAEVEAYLNSDAEARAFVERIRRIDKLAAQAYANPIFERPPQRLVDAIMTSPQRLPETSKVIELARRGSSGRTPPDRRLLPFAAMLALATGLGLTYAMLSGSRLDSNVLVAGPVASGSPLAELLEKGRSGDAKSIVDAAQSDGRVASVVSTFRDKTNRYCREIELKPDAAEAEPISASIACRSGEGSWTIEGSVAIAKSGGTGSPGFEPSGSENVEPLASLLTSLGAGPALDSSRENAAVQSGWPPSR